MELSSDVSHGTLIGLHGADASHRQIVPLLRVLADGRRIVAPRSARWSGFTEGGCFSWFLSLQPPQIEPMGFGDALAQLESLAREYADLDHSRSTVLVGFDQGATMALALAALWPDLFAGVIAIDGGWPQVPGWRIPLRDMAEMPVLSIGGPTSDRAELESRNALVTTLAHCGLVISPSKSEWSPVRHWLARTHSASVEDIR